ncbi:MAG TPA: 3-hydroxyacyl-ACP dehydratase FabZ [Thermoanaerobaculales bacterium]|nr:3-hydroxyacyl-ACP dehydratase FabZ [Thermoanaerobaculales bacterium]HPA80106.1 3-hydroxyacyl-ACP dehydratase FabZ [Thermoanaerobaculales bacterium]HQL29178.1 3-hydroxyacyl-ACP dehydratase FabZ [Thermoanaerobaculales bacterium]HQN95594.1 3-hydroxyacyl-ACP dehydratase FabZ [Thermoanaerobaculales bacterium]
MMDIEKILDVLPHRYPFLLIDRVLEVDSKHVQAIKNVTVNEPFFAGHFPQRKVMPGVLIVEAIAQAGGFMMLTLAGPKAGRLIYFTGIDNCRFRRPVVPGDQLVLEVELVARRSNFAKMHGRATVNGELACEADLMSAATEA